MDAMIEEVEKLKEASAITKVLYSSWLSRTGKWRVCIDFTSLNRACLKDYFLLRKLINRSTLPQVTPGWVSWMLPRLSPNSNTQARSREDYLYHPPQYILRQIILFELKNTKATYQRMVSKIFKPIMGKTMDAYIDVVIKRKKELDH